MNKFSKRILSSDLPKLLTLAKEFVNDGLWFLYEDKDQEGKYFLIAGDDKDTKKSQKKNNIYVLDKDGDVIGEENELNKIFGCRAVYFSDIRFPPSPFELVGEASPKELKEYVVSIPEIHYNKWAVMAESEEEAVNALLSSRQEGTKIHHLDTVYYDDLGGCDGWIIEPQEEKEFIVSKPELHYSTFKIKAKKLKEAEEKVRKLTPVDPEFISSDFSHDLGEDQWIIEEVINPQKRKRPAWKIS